MRVLVAAGALWLLFGMGLMLRVAGERRLMRAADSLLGVEFVALIGAGSLDSPSLSAIVGLVVAPSLAVGFGVYCLQRAFTGGGRR